MRIQADPLFYISLTAVIAATIKLWLLELSPPILGYDCYESMKTFYKKGDERNSSTEDAPQPLVDMLAKLSSPQILVLDAILAHFNALITNTKTEESNDAYITKLSLSVGRRKLDILLPAPSIHVSS